MTSQQLTADVTHVETAHVETAHFEDPNPAGEPKVSPMVAFGLRTAALAGLAIPVGLPGGTPGRRRRRNRRRRRPAHHLLPHLRSVTLGGNHPVSAAISPVGR